MPIRTQSADGITHEFPDDTKPEVVDKAMKEYAESQRDKSTTAGEIGTGMMDPVEGGGQLIANILPARVERGLNELNNLLAEHSGGLIRKLPEGGKNEQMQQREAEIQKQRGSNTSMDWARFAGNILSPINYIGGLVGPEVKAGMSMLEKGVVAAERGEIAGATAGAMQPATQKGGYGHEKAMQIGEGAVAGGLLSGAMAGAGAGVNKLGEFVARNYPDNVLSTAVQAVLKRISQDQKSGGPTAAQAIQLLNAAKEGPWGPKPDAKPLGLIDVTGEATQGLGGRVARQPGEGRNRARSFLEKRDEKADERLSRDIATRIFGGPTMHQASEALLQARSAVARPLYQDAHALQGIWSPRLEQFLQDPVIKAGLARGYNIERQWALAEDRAITSHQLGVELDTEGNIKMLDKPNMLLLDMGKQGLDAMIADARVNGRLTKEGVALSKVRDAYVKTIDDLDTTGAYKKARAAWAGYSQSLDSIELGRNVLKLSPEENAAEIAKLSEPNKEFYRLGVADMLKERLLKAGLDGDEAKALIKNKWMREQLRPAFRSGEDFDQFVDAVTQERGMFKTKGKILGGPATAERLAEDTAPLEAAASMGKAVKQAANKQLFDAAKTTFQLLHDMAIKPNEELNGKIAEILFTSDLPSGVQDLLMRGAQGGGLPKRNPASNMAEVLRMSGAGMAPIAATDLTKERSPQQATP
jgi:hypothetical protein